MRVGDVESVQGRLIAAGSDVNVVLRQWLFRHPLETKNDLLVGRDVLDDHFAASCAHPLRLKVYTQQLILALPHYHISALADFALFQGKVV